MALRPIFSPIDKSPFVKEELIDFTWHKGRELSQKQESIRSLHSEAKLKCFFKNTLEISTKSDSSLGIKLSAFNLGIKLKSGMVVSLENVFQAAKIFEFGGPFKDILYLTPSEAKADKRLKSSGKLIGFISKEKIWPLEPKTVFYDWLYLNAIRLNPGLGDEIMMYDSFTDIEFNPNKSFNCQAKSAALYVSLRKNKLLDAYLSNSDFFFSKMNIIEGDKREIQLGLF